MINTPNHNLSKPELTDTVSDTIIALSGNFDKMDLCLSNAGEVSFFAMTAPPLGWLKADGSAISRATYSILFSKIGTTFGIGDGSTTFNIPDLRGYFVRGYDNGRNIDNGRIFGSNQTDDLKSHLHTQSYPRPATNYLGSLGGSLSDSTATTCNTGSTGGTETRPKNIALLACIKY